MSLVGDIQLERLWQRVGFDYVVLRMPMGHLCGYVRVPEGHPWHGLGEDADALRDVEVHGGLTFASKLAPDVQGEAPDGFWLGFDCAHAWDATDPAYLPDYLRDIPTTGHVWTVDEVVVETERLADQFPQAQA